jgi:polyisoprenoid-binding protein YceI
MEIPPNLAAMTPNVHFLRRFFHPDAFISFILLALLAVAPVSRAQETIVQIDSGQTKIEFSLGATMHTVHGTFALKSSSIWFDSSSGVMSGTIVVDARTGESGNSGRDARMHREILESSRFPEIAFFPSKLVGTVGADGASKLEVSGRFQLLGQDHEVTLPMEVKAEGTNLQIAARFDIPYVQWGLKNPSNFLLRVSDKVSIEIQARGRLQSAGNH